MNNMRIFFVGNRFGVLNEIMKLHLHVVRIYTPHKSYLAKELRSKRMRFSYIAKKEQLFIAINESKFDILVSNGCPYIIPVSRLKKQNQIFVNVHPSLLPDLQGRNPVNGCKLFNREAGATCHIMDDGIDTGGIISQVNVEKVEHIDVGVVYKLCFLAEAEAFRLAYTRNFKPISKQPTIARAVYYTRKEEDLQIDFNASAEEIVRRINAFGVASQRARFHYRNHTFYVMKANPIENRYLTSKIHEYKHGQIAFAFDHTIVMKIHSSFIELENISGRIELLKVGGII